jgi:DNA-binding transcriptional regulator YdaS (Cro superfamily)
MKRKASPPRHHSRTTKPNGSKSAAAAKARLAISHGRTRVPGVASLRRYLKAYGRGADARAAREEFAKRVGTTLPYLQHLILGNRMASMEMAARIEAGTHGQVKAEELHPSPAWQLLRERAARIAQAVKGGHA